MGGDADAVYLLRWENGKGATEASANGPTRIVPLAGGEVTGQAAYANRQYRLRPKRPPRAQGPRRPPVPPAALPPLAVPTLAAGPWRARGRTSPAPADR